jgi:hypothetical protein
MEGQAELDMMQKSLEVMQASVTECYRTLVISTTVSTAEKKWKTIS